MEKHRVCDSPASARCQLGSEDVLSIQKALASARRLAGHFKKSTVSSSFLHQRQRASGHPKLQLISDCATRWNSTYEMARRLLNERVYVELALTDARREDLKLRCEQWDLLEEL